MAEIINLRTVRKQRKRAAERKYADFMSAKFGEATTAARLRKTRNERSERLLDGHRRDGAPNIDVPED